MCVTRSAMRYTSSPEHLLIDEHGELEKWEVKGPPPPRAFLAYTCAVIFMLFYLTERFGKQTPSLGSGKNTPLDYKEVLAVSSTCPDILRN